MSHDGGGVVPCMHPPALVTQRKMFPQVRRTRPKIGRRVRGNSGRRWLMSAQYRSTSAPNWPMFDPGKLLSSLAVVPYSADVGQHKADSAPNLVCVGRSCFEIGQFGPDLDFDRFGEILADSGPDLAR